MYPGHVAVKFWYFTWCQNATKHRAVLRWRIISKIHKLIIIKMVKEFWPNAIPKGWSFQNLLIPLMGGPDCPLGTWTHLSPHPKQHLEQYNSFCRDQCCDQHTQTMLYQTEHLMLCMVMRPNGNHISILLCFINRIHTDHTHTATTMKDIREPQINAPTIITEDGGWFKLRKNRSTETSD